MKDKVSETEFLDEQWFAYRLKMRRIRGNREDNDRGNEYSDTSDYEMDY
jgi:hypothetical protein